MTGGSLRQMCGSGAAFRAVNDLHHVFASIGFIPRRAAPSNASKVLPMKKLAACLLALCAAPVFAQQSIPGSANGMSTYVVSQPGSYKLSGNIISVQTGMHGVNSSNAIIRVDASDVVIDLNGYTIGSRNLSCAVSSGISSCSAVPGRFVVNHGVLVSPGVRNVTIRNGSIIGVSVDGINCGEGCTVEEVTVDGALGAGIRVGNASRVAGSKALRAHTGVWIASGQVSDVAVSDVQFGVEGVYRVAASDISVSRFYRTGVNLGLTSSLNGCAIASGSLATDSIALQLQQATASDCAVGAARRGVLMYEGALLRASTVSNTQGLGIEANVGTGYSDVVLFGNNGGGAQVSGGSSLGGNLCNGVTC